MHRSIILASLLVVVAVTSALAAACASADPSADREVAVPVGPVAMNANAAPPPPQWVTCTVDAVADADPETVVGGQAATLTTSAGHELFIPANALPPGTTVDVTLRQVAGPHVKVQLEPPLQRFWVPLTLTLVYAGRNCVPANQDPDLLDIYRARNLDPGDLLPHPGPETAGRIRGLLDRFSVFAIAQ